MPQLNNEVRMKFGLKSAYTSLSPKDQSTLYFCTDTGELFVGDVPFSPQLLTEMPEPVPDNANSVFNSQLMTKTLQDNYESLTDAIEQAIQNIQPRLLTDPSTLADGTYMRISDHTWVPQSISGSDYTANRLRGIAVYDTAAAAAGNVPEGCFAAILSL